MNLKSLFLMLILATSAGCLNPQTMPEDDGLSPVSASPPMFYKVRPAKEAQDIPNPKTVQNRLHLVSAEKEDLYRSFFPRTDDPKTNALKDQVSFYDEESIPRVYQVWDLGNNSGLKRTDSGQRTANNEFPWAGPAGTLPGDNHKTIRWVRLDRPIEWFNKFTQRGEFDGFGWTFPVGTVFGEILLVSDPEGRDHAAELRTRRKNSEGEWTVNAFRPYPKERNLHDAALQLGFDLVSSAPFARNINSGQQNRPFVGSATLERLPPMPPSLVNSLLDGATFHTARHKAWADLIDGPTADEFSIVPKNFVGGFIPVNQESCARCHEDTGRVVNLKGDTRWRLRGDDRIFSFQPFAPDSSGRDIRFNQKLLEAGLLVHKPGMP